LAENQKDNFILFNLSFNLKKVKFYTRVGTIQPFALNIMDFKFNRCCELEDMKGMCKAIEVPISRHPTEDEQFETLRFKEELPICEAVKKAEEFLSVPLTKEHYQKVQALEDWWYTMPFEEYEGKLRGDLLGDLHFLEDVRLIEDGVAILDLGS